MRYRTAARFISITLTYAVIARSQSDRGNLLDTNTQLEIAASTLKNTCFTVSPRNDEVP